MGELLWELLAAEETNEHGLPPGFRFHPTDEELVTFYLASKVFHCGVFTGINIIEVDLNRCEPWEIPDVAKMGEKEWYFYSLRDRKYPTGLRTNRATGAGYWKATGKDREVYCAASGGLVGMKKTLVFYRGRAPRGEKTKWVLHEYRLDGELCCRQAGREEWVICRIFHKGGSDRRALFYQGAPQSYHQCHYLNTQHPSEMEPSPSTNPSSLLSQLLEYSSMQQPFGDAAQSMLQHHYSKTPPPYAPLLATLAPPPPATVPSSPLPAKPSPNHCPPCETTTASSVDHPVQQQYSATADDASADAALPPLLQDGAVHCSSGWVRDHGQMLVQQEHQIQSNHASTWALDTSLFGATSQVLAGSAVHDMMASLLAQDYHSVSGLEDFDPWLCDVAMRC